MKPTQNAKIEANKRPMTFHCRICATAQLDFIHYIYTGVYWVGQKGFFVCLNGGSPFVKGLHPPGNVSILAIP